MKNFILNLYHSDPFIFIKGILIFLIGPLNLQLGYLLIAVAIDLIFGIQVSRKEKTFKWKLLFTKVRSKFLFYALWISMFHAFDMITGLPNSARWAVIVMLAGMELMSAVKNTSKLGHNNMADALETLYLTLFKISNTTKDEGISPTIQQAPAKRNGRKGRNQK